MIIKNFVVWNLNTYELVTSLSSHTASVYCLCVLKAGNSKNAHLASGSADKTILIWQIWSTSDGVVNVIVQATLVGHTAAVNSLEAISVDLIASGSADSLIKFWSIDQSSAVSNLADHTDSVVSLKLLNSSILLSISLDNTLKSWFVPDGQVLKSTGFIYAFYCIDWLTDGILTAGDDNGFITVLTPSFDDFIDYKYVFSKVYGLSVSNQISSNSLRLLVGNYGGGAVFMHQIRTGDIETILEADNFNHLEEIFSLTLINRNLLAAGSCSYKVYVWDWRRERRIWTLKGHSGDVTSLQVLANGSLASGSDDDNIRIWNMTTGSLITVLRADSGIVLVIKLLHNGNIVSSHGNEAVKLFQ